MKTIKKQVLDIDNNSWDSSSLTNIPYKLVKNFISEKTEIEKLKKQIQDLQERINQLENK